MLLLRNYSGRGIAYLVVLQASLKQRSFLTTMNLDDELGEYTRGLRLLLRTMNPNDEFGECTRVLLLISKPIYNAINKEK